MNIAPPSIRLGTLLACFLGISDAPLRAQLAPEVTASGGVTTQVMAEAAVALLESLNDPRRERAQFDLEDPERLDWAYIPTARRGVPIADMTGEQRLRTHELLRTALSSEGYLKVISVMQLEEILRALETSGLARNVEGYYLSIFGDPASGSPWGWRFEGHHVSLNFTSVPTRGLAVTPFFLGSNPAEVRAGSWTGLRVMAEEEDVARQLLASLSREQRSRAVFSADAPNDIETRDDPVARELPLEGLPAADMTPDQRLLLVHLLEVYAGNLDAEIADERLSAIREAGIENLRFAWAGGTARGEPHYYRIQGPTLLIEYDNVQNGANHIHAVWRDRSNDFGADILRLHYETAAHHRE